MIRTLLLVAALALLPVSSVEAQAPLTGGELVHRIDSLAAASLDEGPVPGMTIGVKRGDDLLLLKGYGFADLENGVDADAGTVYRIGSITKQFTAAAIMRQVEAGRVGLDDPITDYLPDYPTQGHTVTIRHLLTHTSGIRSYTSMESWGPRMREDLADAELIALFEQEPFDFAPGERYLYNNSAYFLLGVILEKVTGTPYRDWIEEELFAELGMAGSSYCDERRIIPNRAEGYEATPEGLINDEFLSMNHPGAAGALCSTVPDLLRWTVALRSGEVVSPESWAAMTTPATLNDGSATTYGFGLDVRDLEGVPGIAHGGGINGFTSMMSHYPEAELDVVVLTNVAGPEAGRVAEVVSRWALGLEVVTVADRTLTAEELSIYEGAYELGPDFELTVFARDGQLWSRATGQGEIRMRAQGEHVFIPTFDDSVRVVFDVEDGRAVSLTLRQGGREIEAPRIG